MNVNTLEKYDYTIIGAGIIGTHCAWQLRKKRPEAKILVVDRELESYNNASCGNMAGFATCEVQPLATVGNILRAFKWMLDPLSPFTLRPTKIPTFLPWMIGFVQSAFTRGHYEHVIKAQEQLMRRAHAAHMGVIAGTPLEGLISREGALCIYRRPKRMERDWDTRWKLFRDRGEGAYVLDAKDLRERLPDLNVELNMAIEMPSILHWKNPAHLLAGLHNMSREAGVEFLQNQVEDVSVNSACEALISLAGDAVIRSKNLIIAAGAWSNKLCKRLGDKTPLNTERGYNTTLPTPDVNVDNLLLFPDDEFVATPMNVGLRLGGTVELAGLDAPPNFRRTDALAENVKKYFPTVNLEGRTEWMGHRPSIPDGLPVIGRAFRYDNVYYAFGHGHVGITQAAVTGQIISDLACGQEPDFDISPFAVSRFRRQKI